MSNIIPRTTSRITKNSYPSAKGTKNGMLKTGSLKYSPVYRKPDRVI
jgi:hypothetical protein